MSLPKYFDSPSNYFDECTQFLRDYQQLYKFPNTDVLLNNILEHIYVQNWNEIDIFDENFDLRTVKDEFLEIFFLRLRRLEVFHKDIDTAEILDENFDVPLSPKKRHEIICLAKEIQEQFAENDCRVVVDFGSGLGYLDQRLYEKSNMKVLGIECNENNYVGAKKRQRKYHTNSLDHVKYVRHTISTDSDKNIENFVKEKFPNDKNFGITGLHACADLSIEAMDIFLKMERAKNLLIIPCCYHKLAMNDGRFENFPLSNRLKVIFGHYKAYHFLNVPFLRLGAQPPNLTDNLEDAVFNLLARAVLQLYANINSCKLKKNKRKTVNLTLVKNDFENYIQDASQGFQLIDIESSDPTNKEEISFDLEMLRKLWREIAHPLTLKKVGTFILLQNLMQPIIENYILFDRLVYLRENDIENCFFKKIFDEKISPRCLALVAKK